VAVQEDDGTSIPQIQLGTGQLEDKEKRRSGYKKRREATEEGVQKIRERKYVQEQERELERLFS